MSAHKIIGAASALLVVALPARATVLSLTQSFYIGGDFTTDGGDQNIFMPVFDSSLGTLTGVTITIQSTLDWNELYQTVAAPGYSTETVTSSALLNIWSFYFDNLQTTYLDTLYSPSIVQQVPYTFGASGTATFDGTFSDAPARYLDPDSPEDLLLIPGADAICTDCLNYIIDDTYGFISGTLTTSFTYTPAAEVPEPSSFAILALGVIGLGSERLNRRRITV